MLDDCKIGMQSQRTLSRPKEIQVPSGVHSSLLSSMNRSENKPILIPKRKGSLDSSTASSPSSSPSSFDTSDSSCSDRSKDRRVSFNERVKVAVVTHYGISVLRP